MTPLERAARAAAEQHGEDWDRLPDVNPVSNGELDKAHFIELARAVIVSIREPSEVMVNAAVVRGQASGYTDVVGQHHAMIDALLEEG